MKQQLMEPEVLPGVDATFTDGLRAEGVTVATPQQTDVVEALLSSLRSEVRTRMRRAHAFYIAFILLFSTLTIVSILRHNASMMRTIGAFTGMILAAGAVSTKHKEVAKQLATYDDPRVVGPLLEMLDIRDAALNRAIRDRLAHSLPSLRADHAGLLTPHQRERLNIELHERDGRLILAALAALEQVGDSTCIPAVRRLANGEFSAEVNGEIHAAAERCLHYVEQHADLALAQSQLLRGSSAAAAPIHGLLIPASGVTPDTGGAELLRPTDDNRAEVAK